MIDLQIPPLKLFDLLFKPFYFLFDLCLHLLSHILENAPLMTTMPFDVALWTASSVTWHTIEASLKWQDVSLLAQQAFFTQDLFNHVLNRPISSIFILVLMSAALRALVLWHFIEAGLAE